MNRRITFTLILTAMFSASMAFGQSPSPTPALEIKEPVKANSRPSATPVTLIEPFDKADLKTMAAKCVRLETETGEIEIELFPESAPESVRNFLNLAAIGAFDTTTFSRVVPGFVIQGGNLWTREGGVNSEQAKRARQTIPDEPSKILHERGTVSMARPEEANSASTHFFILVDAAPSLDGTFAAFGRVTKGMNVVDAINKGPVEGDKPNKPVRISKVTVYTCPVIPAP